MRLKLLWKPKPVKAALVEVANDVLREAANYMGARAVEHAPIDTAFLVTHIQVVELANNLGFQVISTAHYSPHVEFGHFTTAGTWVPPNPFMRKARNDTVEQWPEIAAKHKLNVGTSGANNPEGYLGTSFTTSD